jgi:purine/pyrimidine-nucleoside phosphorylase
MGWGRSEKHLGFLSVLTRGETWLQKGELMSDFKNVTVVREANIYFDGKVTSRSVFFPDGSKKTLGVMLPGEFEFGTADKELMEILSGELDVLLPGETAWKSIRGGQSFEVKSNAKFKLKVKKLTDYCCSFIKA